MRTTDSFKEIDKLLSVSINEESYDKLVSLCKIINREAAAIRIKIGEIAHVICDVKTGGKRKSSEYTLTQFAKDIRVNNKTLWRWKKEFILIKSGGLEAAIASGDIDRTAISNILNKVNKNTPKTEIEKMYNKELNRDRDEAKLLDMIKRLSTIDFQINHSLVLSKMDEELLWRIQDYCKLITDGISNKIDNTTIINDKKLKAEKMMSDIGINNQQ